MTETCMFNYPMIKHVGY